MTIRAQRLSHDESLFVANAGSVCAVETQQDIFSFLLSGALATRSAPHTMEEILSQDACGLCASAGGWFRKIS